MKLAAMGRCKDCRWWTGSVTPRGWRWCALASAVQGRPEHPDTKAFAVGSVVHPEGPIEGDLLTAPDFGCVQHEAKE